MFSLLLKELIFIFLLIAKNKVFECLTLLKIEFIQSGIMGLKWLEMHSQVHRFKKKSGGGPPSPNERGVNPLSYSPPPLVAWFNPSAFSAPPPPQQQDLWGRSALLNYVMPQSFVTISPQSRGRVGIAMVLFSLRENRPSVGQNYQISEISGKFCQFAGQYTVGKFIPCKLSFVYNTSYIKYGVRTAHTFGKHASLFSYHKDKNYVQAIICSVMSLSFSKMCMLENIC